MTRPWFPELPRAVNRLARIRINMTMTIALGYCVSVMVYVLHRKTQSLAVHNVWGRNTKSSAEPIPIAIAAVRPAFPWAPWRTFLGLKADMCNMLWVNPYDRPYMCNVMCVCICHIICCGVCTYNDNNYDNSCRVGFSVANGANGQRYRK